MRPIVLGANQPPDRFYRGGELIARFRGEASGGDHVPEDWVASTTSLAGHPSIGLTTLPDGRTLREAVESDPEGWLGPHHLAAFGVDSKLLVKLLHAGERLPVHAHPDASFALATLGHAHGKAEAWHILVGGDVYLGLTEPVDAARLAALTETQDVATLLGLLNRVRVEPGDTVFVPAGVLHAIGHGILLAELQEPEDLSILLEWDGFAIDGATDGHLGLGFDIALSAVDRNSLGRHQLDALITSDAWGANALADSARDFFRLERHRPVAPITIDPGFAVLIVTAGDVTLTSDESVLVLPSGSTVVLPWAAGAVTLSGNGDVLVARPPAAS